MVDFSILKKNKAFDQLQKKLEKNQTQGGFNDARFWKQKPNAEKKFYGIIRLLPVSYADYKLLEEGKVSADMLSPIVTLKKNNFKGPNGWYNELNPSTIGLPDPIRDIDGPQWGPAKAENDKKLQSQLKERISKDFDYANILVIKDGNNPENDGKNFLFAVPKTILKMIETAGHPEFEDEQPRDVFDVEEGCNLIMRVTYEKRTIGGKECEVPIYDACKFDNPSALLGGDEEAIERVWKQSYSLQEFILPENFKSYDELKKKYCAVLGLDEVSLQPKSTGSTLGSSAAEFLSKKMESEPEPELPSSKDAGDDDSLAEFEKLLQG